MISARTAKTFDVLFTVLVTIAAAFLVWTQIEARWLQPPSRPTNRPRPQEVKGLSIEAAKIRHSKGSGPIVLVEFTDYECPFCGRHARTTAPAIDTKLVTPGAIRHVVFNFPLERIHPNARKASEAAECAARQGRYWEMHERLFTDPAALTLDALKQAGESLGLDGTRFAQCLAGEAGDQITLDVAEGQRLGVNSTPTFFLGRLQPDGSVQLARRIEGALPFEDFKEALAAISK
jgi:protein-disulfide isomerase